MTIFNRKRFSESVSYIVKSYNNKLEQFFELNF